jgi:hypothetical protein
MDQLEKEIEILKLLQKNMIEFLDELVGQFEEEGDLIVMRFFIAEQISIEDIMKQFITYVYPYKDKISNKDESFFLENKNVFGSSPQDKVIHFKRLYLQMQEDDRDTLWAWFSCFISICDRFIGLKRPRHE